MILKCGGRMPGLLKPLCEKALLQGEKITIIPVERLQSMGREIALFSETEDLNDFQKWIVDRLYRFELPEAEFTIRSILLIAIPHPAYARVEFTRQGRRYDLVSLVMADFDTAEKELQDVLASRNFHLKPAACLPLKRLAVQSGLAVYGRNNICYTGGMGSFFSLAAYYSDLPGEDDEWMEMRHAGPCVSCRICFNNCPTGAIRADRFLIDNERCLSYLNERPDDFPEWLPRSVHHCVYDCLKCQLGCPMNQEYANHSIGPVKFDQDETELLLSPNRFEAVSPEFQAKSKRLGFHHWPAGIARNLRILFDEYRPTR
jgi:epoxyqueuosine reductase